MNSLKAKLPPIGTLGPAIALILACAFFSFQHERFLTLQNFSLILQQVMVVGKSVSGIKSINTKTARGQCWGD